MTPRVWIGSGARHVEARLLAEVAAWHAAVREDPRRLARPLVVLVPSRSLKDHVAARLAAELRALAGVAVQTHHAVALQILERAGLRAPLGADVAPVLVRQHARRVPVLAGALDRLEDGYGSVTAAVSDLLDAGLDASNAPAARERLAASPGAAWARAAGVVDVALAVHEELARRGLGRLADVIARAREALEADPALFEPAHLLVHGFADATGVVTDFLRTLLRGRDATVLLDRPPDPADPGQTDLGAAFAARFEERIVLSTPEREAAGEGPPRLDCFRAPGTDAEVRAVARRVRERIDHGTAPESIGIVSRTPALYAPALRIQLSRLGIPFSGVGVAGPRTALGRRVAFVVDLLRQRERMPADRFVEAARCLGAGQRADLRLGLHAMGVARLADLAHLDPEPVLAGEDAFRLPVRRGLQAREADAEDEARPGAPEGPFAPARRLSCEVLERGIATARAVAGQVEPVAPAPLGERLAALRRLLDETLGWRGHPDAARLSARLEALACERPADLPVTPDELALVLDRALRDLTHEALGGGGAGVQVLDVTAARARTFEALFVLGLNRDHFPRVISEDPLLPDEVRRPLQEVLPDLPVKERGHDEERFLFAQLVSSSPEVTLSWQVLGDDGKAKAPSPLVERLLGPDEKPELVPTLLVPLEPEDDVRPAHEWALLAGLHGGRDAAAALLPVALAEVAGHGGLREEARRLAAVRMRAVAELDAYHGEAPLLGPWFGHVGAPREAADLRTGALWVTTAEAIARCPWQGFLSRMLKLERPPDALEALPEADALLQGSLVHAVLERIVRDHVPEPPPADRLASTLPVAVPWPGPERFEAILQDEARRVLREAGIGVPGFAPLLAEVVRDALEVARRLEWADGPVPVVGAEVTAPAVVETPLGPRTLLFRADRVDRPPGGLSFVDYKTGREIDAGKREDTRHGNFHAAIRRGKALQAAAYAASAPGATGTYLFLKPTTEEHARRFAVTPGDADLREAFVATVSRVVAASEVGTFPPRLVDASGQEPDPCGWCELSVACLRGDSGARRRLAAWHASPGRGDDARTRALRGILDLEAEAP